MPFFSIFNLFKVKKSRSERPLRKNVKSGQTKGNPIPLPENWKKKTQRE